MIGQRLSHFRILEMIGAGGMGEVYRARDEQLERDVALKVLPAGSFRDEAARARLLREARTASKLNHPHICTIHEVGEADGQAYIAMELVEGQPLSVRLSDGPLRPEELLRYGIQLAAAVAHAHEHGVVHRDLKSANVVVTPDGCVKVLDFGLARQMRHDERIEATIATQATVSLTAPGMVVGALAYMAPEQLRGQAADERSDVWALGVVLYEMATGRRPFQGGTSFELSSAILSQASPPLPSNVPVELGTVVERCLRKEPGQRYRRASEVCAALEAIQSGSVLPKARAPRGPWSRRRWLALAATTSILIAIGAGIYFGRYLLWPIRREAPGTIATVAQVTSEAGAETHPSLSRDGNRVAYAASGEIYLRRVGAENPIHLTADMSLQAAEPVFSPDGRMIAFSARRDGTDVRGGIWVMEITGAAKRRLSDMGFSPAWSPDGKEIAYSTEIPTPYDRPSPSRASIINLTSGHTREFSTEDTMDPAWSPTGRRIAYWALGGGARRDIWTRPAAGGEATPVTDDPYVDWGPVWSHDGRHLFYCSDRSGSANVWRVRIDEETGRVLGQPEPLTTSAAAVMHVSFAADGSRFAYEASDLQANIEKIAFDPAVEAVRGEPVQVTSGTRVCLDVDVSIDGRLVFRSAMRPEDIYVCDSDGRNIIPLAPDENNDRFPRWSPDGTRIAFSSTKGGEGYEIYSIRPDGRDLRRLTFYKPSAVHFPLWSPDGRSIAFTAYITAGGCTYVIDPERPWPSEPLKPLLTPPKPLDLRYRPWSWSANGRHIVAYSERGAGMIVYDVATGAYQKISDTGEKPRWLSDSRRLLYANHGTLCLMDTHTKNEREIYRPPRGTIMDPALSHDDSLIYYIHRRDEGNIWLATLK